MKKTSNLEADIKQVNVTEIDRIKTSGSSKGNQIKWRKNNQWVKADFLGYEGLAECFASWVARHTNIGDFSAVTDYYQCKIAEDSNNRIGCYSDNFLNHGEICVTAGRLLISEFGPKYERQLDKLSTEDRIKTVVDLITAVTKIKNFGQWLTCLLEFDSLILNEDRHFFNIAVINSQITGYRLMPLFDNGAAFCSDMYKDYPLSIPVDVCIRKVKAKPFNTDFGKQIKACRKLYGPQLKISLTAADIDVTLLKKFESYDAAVKNRMISIIKSQLVSFGS